MRSSGVQYSTVQYCIKSFNLASGESCAIYSTSGRFGSKWTNVFIQNTLFYILPIQDAAYQYGVSRQEALLLLEATSSQDRVVTTNFPFFAMLILIGANSFEKSTGAKNSHAV